LSNLLSSVAVFRVSSAFSLMGDLPSVSNWQLLLVVVLQASRARGGNGGQAEVLRHVSERLRPRSDGDPFCRLPAGAGGTTSGESEPLKAPSSPRSGPRKSTSGSQFGAVTERAVAAGCCYCCEPAASGPLLQNSWPIFMLSQIKTFPSATAFPLARWQAPCTFEQPASLPREVERSRQRCRPRQWQRRQDGQLMSSSRALFTPRHSRCLAHWLWLRPNKLA